MENKETVLVTGGTGFVGIHTILQLLQTGYKVKTTLRNQNRQNEVIEMLKNAGFSQFENLEFVEADLTRNDNWEEATNGCIYVLHVASPFPSTEPKNPDDVIIPAKQGTLRVLKAAKNAGVKRVVMTSSFGAIGYSIDPKNHIFTEEDWTDPDVDNTAYIKSKTLAERTAWDFIKNEGDKMELAVINPVGIFGPVLGKSFSSSIQMVEQLMNGKMPATPNVSFGIVDVRDVAEIHIKAMKNPNAKGQRFLASSDILTSLPEIAKILHSQPNEFAKRVTTKVLPDWMVKVLSIFKPELQQVASQLGKVKVLSNEKAKTVLNWQPRSKETIVVDTAESLIKFGIVK